MIPGAKFNVWNIFPSLMKKVVKYSYTEWLLKKDEKA